MGLIHMTYKTQTTTGLFSSCVAVIFVVAVGEVFIGSEMWRGDWEWDDNDFSQDIGEFKLLI